MPRVLAIDYGTTRLGVALSDETKTVALPQPYILLKDRGKLLKLVAEKDVDQIFIGLPKNLAGEETTSARQARKFGDWLRKETGAAVDFLDERLTTRQARDQLQSEGLKDREIRGYVDSASAQILLESYLHGRHQ